MAELSPDVVLATCVENNGPMLLAIGWALLALAIIVIFLRVLFRHRYGNGLHGDDYTMLASLAMGITAVTFLTFFVNVGFGQHIYCLSASAIPLIFKYSILAQIFNIAGIGLVKISVCLHILRIIHRARRDISIFLGILILITSLSHLAQIILFCVQCRPMPAIWDPQHYPNAKCFSSHITYLAGYIGFGLDAFTDLVTAVIPVVVIRALQMNTRTKAALCVLMGLGVLTAICAIAKAITLQGVFAADYTWALWRPGLCTIIEHLIGMIIASAPALNPLFKRALRTPTSLYGSGSSHQSVREKRVEKDRQSRRVTRWADAWTPPNVHVAHYSPYAHERIKHCERIDDISSHDHLHYDSGNSNTSDHRTSEPLTTAAATNTSTSSSFNTRGPNTSLTVVCGSSGRHCNEITKTVSFRRVSEHENEHEHDHDHDHDHDGRPARCKDFANVNAQVMGSDHKNYALGCKYKYKSYNNNDDDDDDENTVLNADHLSTGTTTLARHSANDNLPMTTDRLWIGTRTATGCGTGTGYWDLPSAPPPPQSALAAAVSTSPGSLPPPSAPALPHKSVKRGRSATGPAKVGLLAQCSTSPEQDPEQELELDSEPERASASLRALTMTPLEPHPAVGRWVGSGGAKPLAREEEGGAGGVGGGEMRVVVAAVIAAAAAGGAAGTAEEDDDGGCEHGDDDGDDCEQADF